MLKAPGSVFLLATGGEMRQLLPVEAKNLSWGTGATTALVALPILYFLSVGPALFGLQALGDPLNRKVETAFIYFYSPLGLLAKHTPLREPLHWYVELWVDLY